MMRGHVFISQSFAEMPRHALGHAPRVHEYQRGPVCVDQFGQPVVILLPHFVRHHRFERRSRDLDAQIHVAPVSLIDVNIGFIGLKAFAAAVLGGFGSIPGALAGGVTIGVIELLAGAYLPQGFKDVAAYVVLLLVLAVRPQGMFGTVGRKRV